MGIKNNLIDIKDIPLKKIGEYAAEDADITLSIMEYIEEKIKRKNLETVFYDIEIPLIPVLSEMENNGIKIIKIIIKIFNCIGEEN